MLQHQRRFRIIVGALGLVLVGVLLLQYTSYALLPAAKTSMLWGMLVGGGVAAVLVDRQWTTKRTSA